MTAATRLQVPYADTSARQLAFSLTADLQEPLARCDHRRDGLTVSLRLLGASHQVVVELGPEGTAPADRARWCETVACLPGADDPLPSSVADGPYLFTSSVGTCRLDEMAGVVADVTARGDRHLAAGKPAVLGHFPGRPLAMTAVLATADDDVISWDTWHTYPQTAELVITSSVIRRRAEADA
ncbi:DUF2617 family protein [Gordonia sp. ABSL11-1]|uniref:DUF2617 family protein n=1 Tax=Gordonia sp. ABSL11-1 TaxID=3053924 RepID=UPI002572E720|nr:DUF2617 family protein [Gordonia sp. ABSL11-1]MDL9946725.1 DUF2617 family protein [Gordonia sp. ABSL11-1]